MRRVYLSLGILLVLGVITFILLKKEEEEIKKEPTILKYQPVKIEKSKIKKVVIEQYPLEGGERSKELQRIVIVRGEKGNDEGEGWEIVEPVKSEADKYSVKSLLKRLDELKFLDIASEQKKAHEELMVDEKQGIKVRVFYEKDKKVAELIIGKSSGGFTMVRLPGEDKVYRVKGTIRYVFSKPLRQWRNRKILKLDRNKIARVEFINKNGHFAFERDVSGSSPKEWKVVLSKPKLKDFDPSRLNTIVNSLASLTAYDFLDPPYTAKPGLSKEDNPAKVIITVKKDGGEETYTLLIGNQQIIAGSNEKGNYYAKLEGKDQIYVISKYLGERFTPTLDKLQKSSTSSKTSSSKK